MAGETNTEAVPSNRPAVTQSETSDHLLNNTEHVSAAAVELVDNLKSSESQESTKDEHVNEASDNLLNNTEHSSAPVVELVDNLKSSESQETTKNEHVKEASSVDQNAAESPNDDHQEVSAKEETTLEEQNATAAQEPEINVVESATVNVPDNTTEPVATEQSSTVVLPTTAVTTELPAYLYKAMTQVASEQGFTAGQFKLEFDVGSNKGDGFVGQMFKAYLTEGDRREVFLCKIPPLNEARRQQFNTMSSFSRETLAYKTFLPVMFAYQEEKGVAREDGFFNVPKCYYAECNEATEESAIIMDDLRLMDYRMLDKMEPVNYEHARLTMQHLGRLHAVSLALKRDRPEEFEKFKVPDPLMLMMHDQSPFEPMLEQMIKNAMESLDPHETKERAKMQKLAENMRQEMLSCTDGTTAEPYTVLGHGDCWVNNYMFSYKNGAPDNIILLDWQITRYVSPVLDIAYFLFCCTDEEFRRRHYDEMMNIYHNSLATLLEKLGHNPQEVFPRTALMRQLRRYGKFGILMAVFLVPMMCTRPEDLHDLDDAAEKYRDSNEMDLTAMTMNANQRAYRTRMSTAIRDMVRYGYL